MGDGIGQRQRASPGPTKKKPLLDTKMNSKCLDVGNQILCRVLRGFAMWCRTAATALVEQHAVESVRVEKPPVRCRYAGARTAVKEQHRPAIRTTNLFEINVVKASIQLAAAEGRLYRKQFLFLYECVCHSNNIT